MNKLFMAALFAASLLGCATSPQGIQHDCYAEVKLDGREYAKYQKDVEACQAASAVPSAPQSAPQSDGMGLGQMLGTAFAEALHRAAIRAEVRSWEKD